MVCPLCKILIYKRYTPRPKKTVASLLNPLLFCRERKKCVKGRPNCKKKSFYENRLQLLGLFQTSNAFVCDTIGKKIHIPYLQRTNVRWYPSEDTDRASVSVDLYYPRVRFKQAVGVNAMDTCFIHTNTKACNCFYCIVYFIVHCMFVLCCE